MHGRTTIKIKFNLRLGRHLGLKSEPAVETLFLEEQN
jgi:hypothetical protein